jgi:hypothetical protein
MRKKALAVEERPFQDTVKLDTFQGRKRIVYKFGLSPGGFSMPSTSYENLDVETWHATSHCVGLKQRFSKCQAIQALTFICSTQNSRGLRGIRGLPRLYIGFFTPFRGRDRDIPT